MVSPFLARRRTSAPGGALPYGHGHLKAARRHLAQKQRACALSQICCAPTSPFIAQSLSSLFCVLWWYLDHCPLLPFSSSSCLFCAAANQQGRERRASRRRTIVIGRR